VLLAEPISFRSASCAVNPLTPISQVRNGSRAQGFRVRNHFPGKSFQNWTQYWLLIASPVTATAQYNLKTAKVRVYELGRYQQEHKGWILLRQCFLE